MDRAVKREGEESQEVGRRKEEQRVGPSSSASLDAAASKTLSDGSQPPLGTMYNVRIGLNTRTQKKILSE